MVTSTVFRVQDTAGHGPFRPYLLKNWQDPNRSNNMLSWRAEFGPRVVAKAMERTVRHGGHYGCGVKACSMLSLWLSAAEQQRLAGLGFFPAELAVDLVLAESMNQVVFWRAKPLHLGVVRAAWPDYVRATEDPPDEEAIAACS